MSKKEVRRRLVPIITKNVFVQTIPEKTVGREWRIPVKLNSTGKP